MKIGLMGFEFSSANKGCEALVYSFLNIVNDELEIGTEIYNFSGTELGKVSSSFPKFSYKISGEIKYLELFEKIIKM